MPKASIDGEDETCRKCRILMELYQRTLQAPRDYWLMTELFVMLHDGDVCSERIEATAAYDPFPFTPSL